MADNIDITPGTGRTIAGDEVGGALYQRIKIALGADGTAVDAVGGTGAVGSGVQRITVASDDPVSTALAALGDWDESDRAKVNIIAGSAGVDGNTGTVGAGTLRVTVATDDTVATDLAAIKTAVQIMDDWDQSDRAKVNLIVGQAGIAAGAGVVDTTTPRVTLASDDPAVDSLGNIDTNTATANIHLNNIATDTAALVASDIITSGYLSNMNTNIAVTAVNSNNIAASLDVLDDWDESDRAKVNIIAGQAGIAAGAGAVTVATPRVTLASDDPVVTSVQVMDDWDESDRAKVNIIVGQAGVAAGSGIIGTTTQRVTIATDDTVATDLTAIRTAAQIIDDWDESDRAKVNPIAGQAGVAGGAGIIGATTQRVTIATDDTVATDLTAIKTAVQIMDDWDESDRAKVNLIAGQVGITAGAGIVGTNTPRVTLASDDPLVTSAQIMDDWDESDRAKVNIIVGQAGITAGAGAVTAATPRVTLASDDPVVTSVQIMDDWDESDRAKVNLIVGQAGVAANTGTVGVTTQRVTIATDDAAITALQLIDNIVQVEDLAHSSGHSGAFVLATRQDTKLSTAGSSGDYTAFTTNARGELYIDGGKCTSATGTFFGTTTGSYVDGDSLGGKRTISSLNRATGEGGIITGIELIYRGSCTANPEDFEIWLFRDDPTGSTITDSSALVIVNADVDKLISVIVPDRKIDLGGMTLYQCLNLSIPYSLVSTTMYAVLTIRNSPTIGTSSFIMQMACVRD